jgi:abelson tyrosine-protein kinase 1
VPDLPDETAHKDLSKWRNRPNIGSRCEEDPESPSVGTGSSLLDSFVDEEYTHIRMESPPPLDKILADTKDERRYRMLLQHEFHPSRTFLLTTV